jgi:CelD/BcsL family acetyltransferase involved in cellulose biosynthesis
VSLQRGNRQVLFAIRDEWRALCTEGLCNDPRLGPDWIDAYLAAFEPDANVALITIRSDGRLRGVLPLVEKRFGPGPFALRWYRSASGVHSSRFDLVHGAGDGPAVIAALWQFLREWREWDVLHLRGIMTEGHLASVVALAEQNGHPVGIRGRYNIWRVPFDPGHRDLDAIIASRSKRLRKKLRRDSARLAERGELQLRCHAGEIDPALFRKDLEAFYALEAAGWKGSAGTAIVSDPQTLAFYNGIATVGLGQGFMMLHLLELDGRLVAGQFSVLVGDEVMALKTTYDEALSDYSPGHVLTAYLLADIAGRGLTCFDLGPTPAAESTYKSAWTSETQPGYTALIHQRNVRGRVIHFSMFRLLPWAGRMISRLRNGLETVRRAIRRQPSRQPHPGGDATT